MHASLLSALPVLALAQLVAAGCETHTFGYCEDRIVHWYDPNTGEICDPLDCGGGRAPVKYNVPGCAAYTGTETRKTEASFMPCFSKTAGGVGKASSTLATHSSAATTTEASSSAHATSASHSSSVASSTASSSKSSSSSAESSAVSSATTSATTPATTPAPTAPSTTGGAAAPTSSVPVAAGSLVRGSMAGVAAVAIGALVLL